MGKLSLENLRTEYRKNPLGIDAVKPRFSWELVSDQNSTIQTAYRVVVSCEGKTFWDSQKVWSNESIHVVYGGEPLFSRSIYRWNITVWDNHGSEARGSAAFEMGLFQNDWIAKWIEPQEIKVKKLPKGRMSAGTKEDATPPDKLQIPPTLFRKEFRISGKVRKARLYATAHGTYGVEINQKSIDKRLLAPEFTPYDKWIVYQTYDVADALIEGENALCFTVADGWYAGRVGLSNDNCQYGDTHALLAQLEIEYVTGEKQIIPTDNSFRFGTGYILYSDLFLGEKQDGRLKSCGVSKYGYDTSAWKTVLERQISSDNITAQMSDPIRIYQELPAKEIIITPKGDCVIDFGQNIAGFVRFRVKGTAGQIVELDHSEVLDEYGNFLLNIPGKAAKQHDVFILTGNDDVFEPQFTYHGFRYTRLINFPSNIDICDFSAVMISSDMEDTAWFSCSNNKINRLWENTIWSQRANTISIPTDCPQREKAGWTGDMQMYSKSATMNADMDAFLTSWLNAIAYEQKPNGIVPIVVPYINAYKETFKAVVKSGTSAGWGDAVIVVPYVMYRTYGDRGILEKHYDNMTRWMDYVERIAATESPVSFRLNPKYWFNKNAKSLQKYLWNTGFHFGDWLIPSKSGKGASGMITSAFLTKGLVAPCYYAYSSMLMEKIAATLGKTEDAKKYRSINEMIRSAFDYFHVNQSGKLSQQYQGLYVLALKFDLAPQDKRPLLAKHLVELIEKNGDRLDTGFASVEFLLDVLCDIGRMDKAYKILYQEKSPSWLYEVNNGATTIWESWDAILPDGKVTNMSYNHYSFGCVDDWIYRRIAGINNVEAGFKKFLVMPQPDAEMNSAALKFHSVYGNIAIKWKRENGKFALSITVPCNTTAEVIMPNGERHSVGSGSHVFSNHE